MRPKIEGLWVGQGAGKTEGSGDSGPKKVNGLRPRSKRLKKTDVANERGNKLN